MPDGPLDRMRTRANAVRTRAEVRRWQYRQRRHAAGVWYRLRRVLARAQEAYSISEEDALRLVSEGYIPEECGTETDPQKTILFVARNRMPTIDSRRPIPVNLGPDFLAASSVALVGFGQPPLRRLATGRHNGQVDLSLPGADLIERGLADLARGEESVEALLVSIGAPRLRGVGLTIDRPFPNPERRLYDTLAREDSDSAHSRYNALIRRLVSFESAAERLSARP